MDFSSNKRIAKWYYLTHIAAPLLQFVKNSAHFSNQEQKREASGRAVIASQPRWEHATTVRIDLELIYYSPGLDVFEKVDLSRPTPYRSEYRYNWGMNFGKEQRWGFASPEHDETSIHHFHRSGSGPKPLSDIHLSSPSTVPSLLEEFIEWLNREKVNT